MTDIDLAALRTDDHAWDAFVASTPNGSLVQLSAWARASARTGWSARRVVAGGPDPIGAQLLLHRMAPSPWSRGVASRGPVARHIDQERVAAFSAALREAGGELRLSHVVMDPELEQGHPLEGWLATAGWRRSASRPLVRQTRVVDLLQTEERLWSDFRSSARWSVNRARRAGFRVADAGIAALDEVAAIYLETAARAGFQPGAAMRAVCQEFARDGDTRLLVARSPGDVPVAMLVLIPCGPRITEVYGGATTEGLHGRANYLLKWEAMRTSRERGYAAYDFMGTDVPGLAEFKQSFGGQERTYVEAWELVTNPTARRLLSALQLGRRLGDRARSRRTGADQGQSE